MLLLRFVFVLIRACLGRRAGPLDTVWTKHRAWLSDCDLNFHLNEGSYLTASGMGRLTLMVRVGLLGPIIRKGWRPAAGGAVIQYFRSIPPYAGYTIASRIVGWDGKYLFFEHRFERGGRPVARILIRTVIRDSTGNLPPATVMAALGHHGPPPPAGAELEAWERLRQIQRPEKSAVPHDE